MATPVGELYPLLGVLLALMIALQQWGRMRRRGARIEWAKTILTALGVIVVTAAAIGALFLGLAHGGLYGLGAFAIVEGIGLTALIVAVNRRWPPPRID